MHTKMTKKWPFIGRSLSRAYASSPPSPPTTTTSFPLKHVTKSNFESALAELRSHVRVADFVAIDLEMTGVASSPWRESFEFDRSDVRYLKVKDSAEKFAVVQFGVCPFRWDPLLTSFVAHPHNFYIFPRQELKGSDGPCNEFLCQTTSIDFLSKYQFDFNVCIREGVSYLSRVQENEAMGRLSPRYMDDDLWTHSREVRDVPLVSITDVLFTERMKSRLTDWRNGLLNGRNENVGAQFQGNVNDSKQQFQTIFYKMRPALSLNGFTSHQLRLIQLVTKKHFKDLAYVRVDGENSCSEQVVVYTDSLSDMDQLMKEVKDEYHRETEMKIKAAIGFRHVIDLLSSEQKLIVGHNCFLDIAHIHSKFWGPLPLTAEEFVSSVNKCFPHIVDTKILLNADSALQRRIKKSSTSLSSAFSLLCPHIALGSNKSSDFALRTFVKVELEVDDMRSSNWSSGVKHEAGYDAFMTGCVFAQACSHLGIDFKHHSSAENLVNHEKLQKHINLLYLCWTSGDTIDLSTGNKNTDSMAFSNLKNRFRKILFENIVLIWGYPSKLKALDIKECISKVFGPTSVTSIYNVDETAVFVQFSKAELVSEFLILKDSMEGRNDVISVLHPLSKLLEGRKTCAADYETYVEICGSSVSEFLFADQAVAIGIKWKTKLPDSKIGAQTQEQEIFHRQIAGITKSVSVKVSKKEVEDDSSIGPSSSCREILDSSYVAELKPSRATCL